MAVEWVVVIDWQCSGVTRGALITMRARVVGWVGGVYRIQSRSDAADVAFIVARSTLTDRM